MGDDDHPFALEYAPDVEGDFEEIGRVGARRVLGKSQDTLPRARLHHSGAIVVPEGSPTMERPPAAIRRLDQATHHITTGLELLFRHHPQISQGTELTQGVSESTSGLTARNIITVDHQEVEVAVRAGIAGGTGTIQHDPLDVVPPFVEESGLHLLQEGLRRLEILGADHGGTSRSGKLGAFSFSVPL